MLNDGGGLMLRVMATGGKSWVYRYMENGKSHDLGLGPLHIVSLAEAREAAAKLRRERFEQRTISLTPHQRKQAERTATPTFEAFAGEYITTHASEWRGRRTEEEWRKTAARYLFPELGKLTVDRIDTDAVLRALRPLWDRLPEQGSRVRGRLETILDAAGAAGHRDAAVPNPARWSGHLEHLLVAVATRGKRHHAAMPYTELPAFMQLLGQQDAHSARALQFVILTGARVGEVCQATWDQFDFDNALWIVPASATKMEAEQRVPLSAPAIALLQSIPRTRRQPFPVGPTAVQALTDRLGGHFTTHGFRSTFSTWVAETTDVPPDIREAALAHFKERDRTAAAYQRGDLLAKRRELMDAWAKFIVTS
jgi:integrase